MAICHLATPMNRLGDLVNIMVPYEKRHEKLGSGGFRHRWLGSEASEMPFVNQSVAMDRPESKLI